jgi:hypothetical protein
MLTQDLKDMNFNVYQEMVAHDASVYYTFIPTVIIIGEMWITILNPETKCRTTQWKHTASPPPKKSHVDACAEKIITIF